MRAIGCGSNSRRTARQSRNGAWALMRAPNPTSRSLSVLGGAPVPRAVGLWPDAPWHLRSSFPVSNSPQRAGILARRRLPSRQFTRSPRTADTFRRIGPRGPSIVLRAARQIPLAPGMPSGDPDSSPDPTSRHVKPDVQHPSRSATKRMLAGVQASSSERNPRLAIATSAHATSSGPAEPDTPSPPIRTRSS